MLFNSLHFCIFFPIVTVLYYSVPERWSMLVLLLASCYFYASWNSYLICLLVGSSLVDYVAAIRISETDSLFKKRLLLSCSVSANLGLLFTFKYFNFFMQSAQYVAQATGSSWIAPAYNIILPVGISFYTFQIMSYTIDVYKGELDAERDFVRFLLFVTFFPQLVAGPIERAGALLSQFGIRKPFCYEDAVVGLRTFLGGMLLKVVVADNVAPYVDAVYNNVHDYTGWPLLFATYLFAFQIFSDFAGYSYMAIGIARTLGFTLMENFRQPYLAHSVPDFWRRWHISLSTWFRDYLYIPLGGSRVGFNRMACNLFATFLVSGLWHGASWTFVVWGALNGAYSVGALFIPASVVNVIPKLLRQGMTFGLICFSWIFFRANSVHDAWYVVTHLFGNITQVSNIFLLRRAVVVGRTMSAEWLFGITLIVWISMVVQAYAGHIRYALGALPQYGRWSLYYAAVGALFLLGEFGGSQFIYFQF